MGTRSPADGLVVVPGSRSACEMTGVCNGLVPTGRSTGLLGAAEEHVAPHTSWLPSIDRALVGALRGLLLGSSLVVTGVVMSACARSVLLVTCGGQRRWRRGASVVAGALLSLTAAVPALAGPDIGSGRECRDVRVPVALAQGQPTDERVYGHLCVQSGRSSDTIQLLVHGCTYTGLYWEFPDPSGGTDRYNYAAAANRAGFATLAIDRIGSGRSSHPLSTKITTESNTFTVHQVVQAIHRGELTAPGQIVAHPSS